MTASTMTMPSKAETYGGPFWERFWRLSGLVFIGLAVAAYFLLGHQPQVGASAENLASFYNGGRTQILISAFVGGNAVLFLLWFVAAIRTTLENAGQAGWGGAATIAGAVYGGISLLILAIDAALAYSLADSGNTAFASGLNDFSWALLVLISFPRAMLIMSAAFGLWRAKLISNWLFALGVLFVVLGVMGGTTWVSGGVWAADGDVTRIASPALLLVWLFIVTFVLLAQRPIARNVW